MKSLRKQKGITLVALVVTIIVLLILAGVSLSLVAGSNGVITRATTTADTNAEAAAKEQVELKCAELVAAYYDAKYVTKKADTVDTAKEWILEVYDEASDGTYEGKYKGPYTLVSGQTSGSNTVPAITMTIDTSAGTVEVSGGQLAENLTGSLLDSGKVAWD